MKTPQESSSQDDCVTDLDRLNNFLDDYPDIKFIRLQYQDYTATPRLRVGGISKPGFS